MDSLIDGGRFLHLCQGDNSSPIFSNGLPRPTGDGAVRIMKGWQGMKWLFNPDNPVMRALSTLADLMILNLLTILCCLPVVTMGAALTALNAAVIKIVQGEDSSPSKDFFRAFRSNFKKGALLGLIFLVFFAVAFADFLAAQSVVPILRPVIAATALLALLLGQYAFALLARYENTLKNTLKNAFLLAVGYFPRTLGMALFNVALWLLATQLFSYLVPMLFLFGLSLPCYATILLMQGIFKNLENKQ